MPEVYLHSWKKPTHKKLKTNISTAPVHTSDLGNVTEGRDAHVTVGPAMSSCGTPGRHVATPGRNVVAAQCKMMSYLVFKYGAKRGLYDSMHLMLVYEISSAGESL